MIKEVSRSKKLREELDKMSPPTLLDSPEHWKAILEMNDSLEKMRRNYRYKSAEAERRGKYIPLDYSLN